MEVTSSVGRWLRWEPGTWNWKVGLSQERCWDIFWALRCLWSKYWEQLSLTNSYPFPFIIAYACVFWIFVYSACIRRESSHFWLMKNTSGKDHEHQEVVFLPGQRTVFMTCFVTNNILEIVALEILDGGCRSDKLQTQVTYVERNFTELRRSDTAANIHGWRASSSWDETLSQEQYKVKIGGRSLAGSDTSQHLFMPKKETLTLDTPETGSLFVPFAMVCLWKETRSGCRALKQLQDSKWE